MIAAGAGSHRLLRVLLDHRASVAEQDDFRSNALQHIKCSHKRHHSGSDVYAALELLLERCTPRSAKELVTNKNDLGSTPFSILGDMVCSSTSAKTLSLLLEAKVDPLVDGQMGRPEALSWAWSVNALKVLLDRGVPLSLSFHFNNEDVVLAAIGSGRREAVEALSFLHDKGVDLFASKLVDDRTVLHVAAEKGSWPVFRYLMDLLSTRCPAEAKILLFAEDDTKDTVAHSIVASLNEDADEDEWPFGHPRDVALSKMRALVNFCQQTGQVTSALLNVRNEERKAPIDGCLDYAMVALLLESQADASMSIAYMEEYHDLALLDLLLSKKADINALPGPSSPLNEPALHRLIESGDVPLTKEWIKRGANVHVLDNTGSSAIVFARIPTMVSFLLQEGLDASHQSAITGETLMHDLAKWGETRTLLHVLEHLRVKVLVNSAAQTLLHVAAQEGQVGTVQALVEHGFDLLAGDREGKSPLHVACQRGHFGVAQYLLHVKCPVDLYDDQLETPLLDALRYGSLDLYELLMKHGASALCVTTQGATALHITASTNKTKLLQKLLRIPGLDVNLQTRDLKHTALHEAVSKVHLLCVEILLSDDRVRVDLENHRGETPITMAAKAEATTVLEVLLASRPLDHHLLEKPMLAAVLGGCRLSCEVLLAQGVNLSMCVDAARNGLLHQIARNGDDDLAAWLMVRWDTGSRGVTLALTSKNQEGLLPCDVADQWDHDRVIRAFNGYLFQQGVPWHTIHTLSKPGGELAAPGHGRSSFEIEQEPEHRQQLCCQRSRCSIL